MTSVRQVPGLTELLENDLDAICTDLATEFGRLCRQAPADHRRRRVPRLLPRAGGVHWNRTRPASRPIDVTVFDNFIARRAGLAGRR